MTYIIYVWIVLHSAMWGIWKCGKSQCTAGWITYCLTITHCFKPGRREEMTIKTPPHTRARLHRGDSFCAFHEVAAIENMSQIQHQAVAKKDACRGNRA